VWHSSCHPSIACHLPTHRLSKSCVELLLRQIGLKTIHKPTWVLRYILVSSRTISWYWTYFASKWGIGFNQPVLWDHFIQRLLYWRTEKPPLLVLMSSSRPVRSSWFIVLGFKTAVQCHVFYHLFIVSLDQSPCNWSLLKLSWSHLPRKLSSI